MLCNRICYLILFFIIHHYHIIIAAIFCRVQLIVLQHDINYERERIMPNNGESVDHVQRFGITSQFSTVPIPQVHKKCKHTSASMKLRLVKASFWKYSRVFKHLHRQWGCMIFSPLNFWTFEMLKVREMGNKSQKWLFARQEEQISIHY